ncbi:MAG: cation diffusion facilitator family transporter [Chitinophagales bacterium]
MSQDSVKSTLRAQQFAVAVGLLLLLIKFGAYFYTHSTTILTDALEGVVNIAAGTFAWYSLWLSSKPKDQDHPYGHGKIEFLSAGFEGALILAASVMIMLKAIVSFHHVQPLEHLGIGMMLLAGTGAANFLLGVFLVNRAKKYRSLVLEADGQHLKTDAYISAAILVGVALIWLTKIVWLDSLFAVIGAAVIAVTGWKLVRKSLVGIMDETDVAIVDPIVSHLSANRKPGWIDLHNLRVIQYGSTLHLDCHITFPWYWNLEQVHSEIDIVDDTVNRFYPQPVEVFIHPDPCIPESCRLCELICTRRQHTFEKQVAWTLSNTISNKKHRLSAS